MRESVSIVIPCYRQAAYVGDAIRSALGQRLVPMEVVVVDDGSDDDVPGAVSEFGNAVRYVRRENGGLSAARNTGLATITGDLVVFLDADDVLLPHMLSELAALHRSEIDATVAYGGCMLTPDDLSETSWTEYRALPADPRTDLSQGNCIRVHTALARAEAIHAVGGFDRDLPSCEDWDLWNRVARNGGRFVSTSRMVAKYRQHSAAMTRAPIRMFHAGRSVLRRYCDRDMYLSALTRHGARCLGMCLGTAGTETVLPIVSELREIPSDFRDLAGFGRAVVRNAALARGLYDGPSIWWDELGDEAIRFFISLEDELRWEGLAAAATRSALEAAIDVASLRAAADQVTRLEGIVDAYRDSRSVRVAQWLSRLRRWTGDAG